MFNTILLQAATGSPGPAGGGMTTLLMIVMIIAIFYFFMIMPQQKKQKKINAFRDSLKNGDKVITAGGIHGRIREVKDNTVILEIADGVRIKIDKNSIYQSIQDVAENSGYSK